mmetsp:Transcript_10338/g.22797  ORF Transcript_10338/g.22797 Transcript_10338/m.22797 type:complete len:209 (-) Transcript_10338:152-778(-)
MQKIAYNTTTVWTRRRGQNQIIQKRLHPTPPSPQMRILHRDTCISTDSEPIPLALSLQSPHPHLNPHFQSRIQHTQCHHHLQLNCHSPPKYQVVEPFQTNVQSVSVIMKREIRSSYHAINYVLMPSIKSALWNGWQRCRRAHLVHAVDVRLWSLMSIFLETKVPMLPLGPMVSLVHNNLPKKPSDFVKYDEDVILSWDCRGEEHLMHP